MQRSCCAWPTRLVCALVATCPSPSTWRRAPWRGSVWSMTGRCCHSAHGLARRWMTGQRRSPLCSVPSTARGVIRCWRRCERVERRTCRHTSRRPGRMRSLRQGHRRRRTRPATSRHHSGWRSRSFVQPARCLISRRATCGRITRPRCSSRNVHTMPGWWSWLAATQLTRRSFMALRCTRSSGISSAKASPLRRRSLPQPRCQRGSWALTASWAGSQPVPARALLRRPTKGAHRVADITVVVADRSVIQRPLFSTGNVSAHERVSMVHPTGPV